MPSIDLRGYAAGKNRASWPAAGRLGCGCNIDWYDISETVRVCWGFFEQGQMLISSLECGEESRIV